MTGEGKKRIRESALQKVAACWLQIKVVYWRPACPACAGSVWAALAAGGADRYDVQW